MQQRKRSVKEGRKEVIEIIDTCKAVEDRRFNPFFIDIQDGIETLNRFYPLWSGFQDHSMDAAALKGLSKVLALQNSQLLYQSSKLYADPEMIASRLRRLTIAKLAEIILGSIHPIIAIEQLTIPILDEALHYWDHMKPYSVRSRKTDLGARPKGLSSDEVKAMGILDFREFKDRIGELEEQLKEASREGPVDYRAFIQNSDYQKKIETAYLVSFLLTYGRASLIEDGKGGLWIMHGGSRGEAESLAIPIKNY